MAQKQNRWAPVVTIIILLIALVAVRNLKSCSSNNDNTSTTTTTTTTKKTTSNSNRSNNSNKGLNRYPTTIKYSKHAQCRMSCRHIDESEVRYILQNGKINYNKSEIGDNPECKRKYAVEGTTKDKQKVRIIFAPCKDTVTVVTVIDLETDWSCDCK